MSRLIRLAAAFLICFFVIDAHAQDDLKGRLRQRPEPAKNLSSVTGARTACVGGNAAGFACDNVDLLAFMTLADLGGAGQDTNDIWGWTDAQTGKEYALVGMENGTAFVDISDPENPVYLGRLPTHSSSSLWRDIKVYADHAFIVSEAGNHGMQVFDLTQLRTVVNPPVTFTETAHYAGVGNAHNVFIDEDTGFAYIVGATSGTPNLCGGGLHMVNIQNPTSPTMAGCYGGDGYTHDVQCVVYNGPDVQHQGAEICFASNEDTLTIVDVTDKANPVMLSRTGYTQRGYTHQGWLTEDQQYFLLDDELDELSFGLNTTTRIWDVADLEDPQLATIFSNPVGSIDHNQYVKGTLSFQSNYTSGLRILDISDINNPFEAGFFDTYTPSNSKSFSGTWSNYPFFDSGVVIVSSITEGLFILEPTLGGGNGQLTVTVTPLNPPIVIPAGGGSFQYDLDITNNDVVSVTFDIWIDIDGPGVARTLGPVQRTLGAGASLHKTFTQNIPGNAPAGSYTLTGNAGNFALADASDSFGFEKAAAKQAGAATVTDWASTLAAFDNGADAGETPRDFSLEQNYPNPFNPTTTIRYSLDKSAAVSLTVYNQLGQRVRTLVQGTQAAGAYNVEWNATSDAGRRVPSGLYLYRLEVDGVAHARTMTLLK